jgi:SHS2 domain-containing protein
MDIKTKKQLDDLMKEFMWLQTIDEDGAVFDAKWRVFYGSLNREDAKIAWKAWLDTINENLSEIKKLVKAMPDEELREFSTSFIELKDHPFMQKTAVHA